MIGVLFLFIVPVSFLLYRFKTYVKKYEDIEKLPGPSIWDIISLYRQTSSNGVTTFFQNINKKYGPIAKIWIKPLRPVIITTNMEFVEKIYKSNELFYTPSFAELESLLRNGLATTKSREVWKNDKQVINNTLTQSYIADRLITYNKKFDELIEIINENLGKSIDIEQLIYRIHAEIIIESINDPQIKVTEQEVNEYVNSRNKCMDLLLEKMNSPHMVGILYKFTESYRSFLESAENIIQLSEEFLKRHESVPNHKRDKNNLIYAMMDCGIPRDRIVDNINTLIAAGYETSTLPLSLALYELGKQPDLQQKILEEILSVVGPPQSPKQITLNDLNSMTYLDCVLKESLRLFFPSPFVDRLLVKDVKVKNMTIPKGSQVIFHMSEILKSEENFQSPNVFNPDRFLPENIDSNAKRAFLPFGFGLKTCPGKHLATATMKLFIAKIIREFEIVPIGNICKVQLKADILFRSIDGIPIVFKKRTYHLFT